MGGDRGVALVEFALVLPVLVALLVGTSIAGISHNRINSLNNGARESARHAACLPADRGLTTWLNAVADVARDSTSGDLAAPVPGQRICVAYVYPAGTATDDRTVALTEVAGVRSTSVGATCFADNRPNDERRVQVRLERTSELEVVFWSSTLTLDAESVVRFERAT